MSKSMSETAVPLFLNLLSSLSGMLDKAVAHAEAGKYAPETLLDDRLFPDMWPLSRQIQQVTSLATRGAARLAGIPIPTFDDTLTSYADLKARIEEAAAFVRSIDTALIDAGEDREISFPAGGGQRTMSGWQYFQTFTVPNAYFHATTAYNILRTNGVPLTKQDFIGGQ